MSPPCKSRCPKKFMLYKAMSFYGSLYNMKAKLLRNKVYVKKSPTHGYGVFAGKNFRKGELIEECYIVIAKGGDKILEDYYFDVKGKYAIFLGFGCIYNHSDNPNADYIISAKKRLVTIKADRMIRKGEELFISYGEDWFTSRGLMPKNIKRKKA